METNKTLKTYDEWLKEQKKRNTKKIFLFVISLLGLYAFYTSVFYFAWNYVLLALFKLPEITFFQAFVIQFVIQMLFKTSTKSKKANF